MCICRGGASWFEAESRWPSCHVWRVRSLNVSGLSGVFHFQDFNYFFFRSQTWLSGVEPEVKKKKKKRKKKKKKKITNQCRDILTSEYIPCELIWYLWILRRDGDSPGNREQILKLNPRRRAASFVIIKTFTANCFEASEQRRLFTHTHTHASHLRRRGVSASLSGPISRQIRSN